jgi:hypothetical protein
MATQDMDMNNESNGDDPTTDEENQEGNSDDDTVVQLMKDRACGKSTMHQSHTTTRSSLQSENKQQLYMDLHLLFEQQQPQCFFNC